MPKKEKHRRVETDEEPSYSDEEGSRRQQTKSGAIGKKEKKIYSISSGGSGFQHKPSIREQQRAAAAEANRRRDSSAKFKSDDNDGVGDFKYEEDTSFVDDMMTQARQKRQLDASQNGRKKKQKSAV